MNDKKIIRVRDVMKTRFDTVDGTDTVAQALDTMAHVETKTLIVRKRHADDTIGIVVLADISRQVLAKDRAPDRVNIYEIMSKPVLTVSPDMDIRHCARLFARFGLARGPVVEDGEVIGVVSLTDMVVKGMVPYL